MEHLDGRRDFPRFCIGWWLHHLPLLASKIYLSCNGKVEMSVPLFFVGIGNPPGSMDMKAYLLQKFSVVEREQVKFKLITS